MSLIVDRINAFSDNYIWLFHQPGSPSACVVDPGAAVAVEAMLSRCNLELDAILVTHHHADHVGGIDALLNNRSIPVYGPGTIAQVTQPVCEADNLVLMGTTFKIMAVPGHTLDHIAFLAPDEPLIFCGDTLFAGGCGRLFEGTPQQMWQSLSRIAQLPANTQVYCAHEYTQSNLRFASVVEPDNTALSNRVAEVRQQRLRDEATVPFALADELATNPFLRANLASVRHAAIEHSGRILEEAGDVFQVIRDWKDHF
ncbi:hydroxyacylglutathione hydrolase [Porticoccus sp.]